MIYEISNGRLIMYRPRNIEIELVKGVDGSKDKMRWRLSIKYRASERQGQVCCLTYWETREEAEVEADREKTLYEDNKKPPPFTEAV